MLRAELLRKIRTFPLAAEKLSRSLRTGDFRSVFRGQGIEFDEVRLYQNGDDVRSIDRNVSARFGRPYIKLYREERDMVLTVLLDCSRSMFAGGISSDGTSANAPSACTRFEQALLAAALLGFSAERAGVPFGAIFFDRMTRRVFRPARGRANVMRIVNAALEARPDAGGSALNAAISTLMRPQRGHQRRGFVVIISDFLATGWEQELGLLCRKQDCLAIRITDPIDTDFPAIGLVPLEDPESGKTVMARTGRPAKGRGGHAPFGAAWAQWNRERGEAWEAICRRDGAATLELSTSADAAVSLGAYFRKRH
jgi:uncharacterized protein (DUF58 family)